MTAALDSWQVLDRHLDELLDLDASARATRLETLAREAPDLAARLRVLLSREGQGEAIEALSESPVFVDSVAHLPDSHEGARLGEWVLLRRVGRGGMSEVFEARRSLGEASQRAAVKVMIRGLGGSEGARRFRQEMAILAQLDDARLSRLIDGGETADGHLWLAMEYVEGQPIDEACDARGLNIRERVGLMIEIASAVDHAHRHLVVHRDLKPANIMLDAAGHVRVLDFGIAKMQAPDDVDGDATVFQGRAFTHHWASPEQLRDKPAGVASDVFQLGQLLYLLVCGALPFQTRAGDAEARLRAIQIGAIAPSARCLQLPAAIAARRGGSPAQLAREARGDLDLVIAHALGEDAKARYPSASALAEDLRRWLAFQPIAARGPNRRYRARKFMRRHWLPLATGLVFLGMVATYSVMLLRQSARLREQSIAAETARARAEAIHGYLLGLFGSADPGDEAHRGRGVDDVLWDGVSQAREGLRDDPELAAQLLDDLGMVLLRRGSFDRAEQSLTAALRIAEARHGIASEQALSILVSLSDALMQQGKLEQARQVALRLLSTTPTTFAQRIQWQQAQVMLAKIERQSGEVAPSEQRLRAALGDVRAMLADATGQPREDLEALRLELIQSLGITLFYRGAYADAEPLLVEGTTLSERVRGARSPESLAARKNLAMLWSKTERPAQAQTLLAQVLDDERALYGRAHKQVAFTLGMLGAVSFAAGGSAQAATYWRQALDEGVAALGPSDPWVGKARLRLAQMLVAGGDRAAARRVLTEALDLHADDAALIEGARRQLATIETTTVDGQVSR